MLIFLILLLPVLLSGVLIARKITNLTRLELVLPVGCILGLIIFTFLLNIIAFLIQGPFKALVAYILTVGIALSLQKFMKSKTDDIEFLRGRELILWFVSILGWGGLVFWKAAHALVGSDTNLYYAIAHSFIRGNFPPQTPWQPDVSLSYHVGTSYLLGAFHFFTGLELQFLHLFFSSVFIFCSAQIIIWLVKRHKSYITFLLANLAVGTVFISFGFFYLVWPLFPIQLPAISSINQLVLWLRDLPTVNHAIEVYGAPINLDGLIYFIFHAFGISVFLSLLALMINYRKEHSMGLWIVICLGLSSLALINESVFIAAFPAFFFGMLLIEYKVGSLFKNIKKILSLVILTFFIVFYQGGIISSSIAPSNLEKSVLIFPKKEDIKDDFISYHLGQEISKLLPSKTEWLPMRWFHVGADLLLIISLILVIKLRVGFNQSLLLVTLFVSGVSSLLAYNNIVPKFLVANGNRFLSFSILFFSLVISFAIIYLYQLLCSNDLNQWNRRFLKIIFIVVFLWIVLPTILPPLTLLSKTRFGENKLVPRKEQTSAGTGWIKEKVPYNQRVMVLDARAPHPSGVARVLTQAGVFSPVFPGDFRAYTIEASPEYLDIAYFLSPFALKKLGVELLLIDSHFFQTLPILRKKQLNDDRYFEILFSHQQTEKEWEKIFKIKNEYITNGKEFDGNLLKLPQLMTSDSKIYVENEENFNPSFIRRAIIFILRDKDLYYLPQSGVYLNVEANINQKNPDENIEYDYLVLGENTNPKDKCGCKTEIVWKGLNNQVVLWRSEYFGKEEK